MLPALRSPGGWEVISMAAEVQGGEGHPPGLPSELSGELREFETWAARGQVRENDLSGVDRGGLLL